MEKFFMEDKALKSVVDPQSVAGAMTGARVKIVNADRVAFLVCLGAGTTTTAHKFTLKQHDAETAGNTFDLPVDTPYYHKVGAATAFTKVEQLTPAAAYDLHALLGQDKAIVVFEVLAEQLRADCKWVSLISDAIGGTQEGSVMAAIDHDFKPAYVQVV